MIEFTALLSEIGKFLLSTPVTIHKRFHDDHIFIKFSLLSRPLKWTNLRREEPLGIGKCRKVLSSLRMISKLEI